MQNGKISSKYAVFVLSMNGLSNKPFEKHFATNGHILK